MLRTLGSGTMTGFQHTSAWLHAGRFLSSVTEELAIGERIHEQVFHEVRQMLSKRNTAIAVRLSTTQPAKLDFFYRSREQSVQAGISREECGAVH